MYNKTVGGKALLAISKGIYRGSSLTSFTGSKSFIRGGYRLAKSSRKSSRVNFRKHRTRFTGKSACL